MVQDKKPLADKGSPGSEELLSLIQSYIKWPSSLFIRRQWVMNVQIDCKDTGDIGENMLD